MISKPTDSFISIRMYEVGFGDCFLVTVQRPGQLWNMVIDCGVHRQGTKTNSLSDVVNDLISNLPKDKNGTPYVDVVVATHHHEDHISGFTLPAWDNVVVKEVWVPFVEDPDDLDARLLRNSHEKTADKLLSIINHMAISTARKSTLHDVSTAQSLAINSSRNRNAADRLLGRNGKSFAEPNHKIRYLPYVGTDANTFSVGDTGGTITILGPSRDPAQLKTMRPPARVGWMNLNNMDEDDLESEGIDPDAPLFNDSFVISSRWMPDHIRSLRKRVTPRNWNATENVLMAASILERAVNNTSIFFLLEIEGVKILFPGDAQHGAWEHVIRDPEKRKLLEDISLYKVGHHGSHNGTSREFVEEIWNEGAAAILPWGEVKQWENSIPKLELLEGLRGREHVIIHGSPEFGDQSVKHNTSKHKEGLWTQVTFSI